MKEDVYLTQEERDFYGIDDMCDGCFIYIEKEKVDLPF
jgi:hypothetical protein